jgi:hypothetical protein
LGVSGAGFCQVDRVCIKTRIRTRNVTAGATSRKSREVAHPLRFFWVGVQGQGSRKTFPTDVAHPPPTRESVPFFGTNRTFFSKAPSSATISAQEREFIGDSRRSAMTKKFVLFLAFAIAGIGYSALQLVSPSSTVNAGGCCVYPGDCAGGILQCVMCNNKQCSEKNLGFCGGGQCSN